MVAKILLVDDDPDFVAATKMVLEKAQQAVLLVEHAIFNVKFAAEEERKITHARHIDQFYAEALDRLDVKLTGARAYLTRIEITGR